MTNRFLATATLSCLITGLGACASEPIETRISSSGTGVPGGQMVMWAPQPEGTAGVIVQRARQATVFNLTQKGFRFAEQAPVMISVGVAERPGTVALSGAGNAVMSPLGGDAALTDSCRSERLLRISITMSDSATGAILYQGRAEEFRCKGTIEQRALPRLVSSAMADYRSPSGERVQ